MELHEKIMELHGKIVACGYALPSKKVSNDDLRQYVDTNDEWIVKRTGIQYRYFLQQHETLQTLCVKACEKALNQSSPIDVQSIDGIIVGTSTGDQTFPSMAVTVQQALGIKSCLAFDVNAACAGFIIACETANNYIRAGKFKRCLVIGADVMSKILDFKDRSTLVLFGDGAGCMLLDASSDPDQGILSSKVLSSSFGFEDLYTTYNERVGKETISMQGKNVYKHSIAMMTQSILDVVYLSPYSLKDVDLIIPHQANKRIIDSIANHLQVNQNKMVITLQDHGNVSAATIPIAYSKAYEQHRIKKDQIIVFVGLGAGYVYGSILVKI